MLVIPIQAVPVQQVLCVLEGQNCQINVYVKNANGVTKVYFDLNSDGVDMCLAVLAHNGVPLDSRNSYDGFQGNLFFVDTQGVEDPQYAGFNSRWFLVYLTPAELVSTEITPAAILSSIPILTLSATLDVTAPNPGNFSWAHGLGTLPFLIEIIPTAAGGIPGAIWGQAGFADATNVYLAASDAGVSATVLVYTLAAAGLTVQVPARTLLVTSPASGPFSIPHTLGAVPSLIEVLPTSAGAIWAQTPAFDGTDIFLAASEAGQTATISVYAPVTGPFNIDGPAAELSVITTAGGDFTVAHNLTSTPSRIEILMLSAGVVWAQTPAFDASNVNLTASDSGVVAKILVYA